MLIIFSVRNKSSNLVGIRRSSLCSVVVCELSWCKWMEGVVKTLSFVTRQRSEHVLFATRRRCVSTCKTIKEYIKRSLCLTTG